MRFLGIDYGTKRVGIAISDEAGHFAFPEAVWANDTNLIAKIAALCQEKRVGQIVIGESKNLTGEANPILAASQKFAARLGEETGLSLVWEPEFLTSAEAERLPAGGARKLKDDMLDASAAALILKSYIDRTPK